MARTRLRDALPQVFAAGADAGPLAALTVAADGMHQPVSDVLDHLDAWFDPVRAPDQMVCYLSSWVDLDWLTLPVSGTRSRSTLPEGAVGLRDLLSASADLAAQRGTAAGMVRFLELATRRTGYTVEDSGAFHVCVRLPAGAEELADTVVRIVAAIKPAHVTAEVVPGLLGTDLPAAGSTSPSPSPTSPDPTSPDPTSLDPTAPHPAGPRRASPDSHDGGPR